MSVVKPNHAKGAPRRITDRVTTVGGGSAPISPVLQKLRDEETKLAIRARELDEVKAVRREELQLLQELKLERDPKTYDIGVWFRVKKRKEE